MITNTKRFPKISCLTSKFSNRQKRAWRRTICPSVYSKWRRSISTQFSAFVPPIVTHDPHGPYYLDNANTMRLHTTQEPIRVDYFRAKPAQPYNKIIKTDNCSFNKMRKKSQVINFFQVLQTVQNVTYIGIYGAYLQIAFLYKYLVASYR